MNDKAKRRKRLLRLPTVENFSRNNWQRTDETQLALSNLDKNPPPFSLGPVKKLCADVVVSNLELSQIEDRIGKIRHPGANRAAIEIIPEFLRFVRSHEIEGVPEFAEFKVTYPIGPNPDGGTLNVPVAPTFVCFLDGELTPVFLIPWTKLAFSNFQKILMSSLIQDALLTHQDFLGCDALVMAFPLIEDTRQRYPVSWGVTSYALMDREHLNHQFLVYGRALRNILAALDEEPDTE